MKFIKVYREKVQKNVYVNVEQIVYLTPWFDSGTMIYTTKDSIGVSESIEEVMEKIG